MSFSDRKNSQQGFTTITLLSIVIFAFSVLMIFIMLYDTRGKTYDSRRLSDVNQIKNALELYSADKNGLYPLGTSLEILVEKEYLALLPTDPVNSKVFVYSYQSLSSSKEKCNSRQCFGYVLKAVLNEYDNPALNSDIDGIIGGVDCNDPIYCVVP